VFLIEYRIIFVVSILIVGRRRFSDTQKEKVIKIKRFVNKNTKHGDIQFSEMLIRR
jgi:hypothetical protein